MVEMAGVRLVDLGKGKYEFRYNKKNNVLLATIEEITTELKGDLFDGYIVTTGWKDGKKHSLLFGVKINNTDIVYHNRIVTSAFSRLMTEWSKSRFESRPRNWSKFVKRIVILDKVSAGGITRRVYRDNGVPVYPADWNRFLGERVGKELLPWYLGNRTKYLR